MKSTFASRAAALAVLVGLTACVEEPTAPLPGPQYSLSESGDGTYLVRFKKAIPASFASDVAALGGEVIFAHSGAGVAAIANMSPAGAALLEFSPAVAAVDADAYTEIGVPQVEGVEGLDSSPESPAQPWTSAFFGRQLWNLNAVSATQTMVAGIGGNESVKVGVLDTGVDYLHPDLAGRVDLALSRSFLSAAENARVPAGMHAVADLHYHGTHVATTIVSNAWVSTGMSTNTTIVGLKVCSPGNAANGFNGSCPTSGTLAAILYAADNGIPIINMSLGGSFLRRNASARGGHGPSFLATINSVMNYANRKGTLVIVSAGNSAIDMDSDANGYKSYCDSPHVVCVSATGPTSAGLFGTTQYPRGVYLNIANVDALASYSNFGGKVTVAAPGGNAIPVWAACSGFTIHPALAGCNSRFYNSPTSWSGSIVGLSGTSMAAPHVTGLAALIASTGAKGAPQIRERLIGTADDLGPVGYDAKYGYGRINAARAMGL